MEIAHMVDNVEISSSNEGLSKRWDHKCLEIWLSCKHGKMQTMINFWRHLCSLSCTRKMHGLVVRAHGPQ